MPRLDRSFLVQSMLPALVFAVLALGQGARADTVQPCTGKGAGSLRPAETGRCLDLALPPGFSPVWSLRLPGTPDAMGSKIQVTGIVKEQHFSPSAIQVDQVPGQAVPALPLGLPLLGAMSSRVFGLEERVDITRTDKGLLVNCGDGTSVAGVALTRDSGRLPTGTNAMLRILALGDSGFQWGVATPGQDASLLMPVVVDPAAGTKGIPLNMLAASVGGLPASFVLLCPLHAASLLVQSIDLDPAPAVGEGLRAAWLWNAERWRVDPAGLIAEAAAQGLRRLYVALSIEPDHGNVADADQLSEFISMASARGVGVWAVEGDPGMATPDGREQALLRLQALHRYQAAAPSAARLGGVQYDIEPYLLPAYRADPHWVAGQWAQTIQALRQHSKLKLDMVLPFWLPQSPMAGIVLSALLQASDSVTIMAYRVDPEAIQQVAEPLLAWGAAQGIPVYVALEAGFLDDELTQFYGEAATGQAARLWLLPATGETDAVLLPGALFLNKGKGYNFLREQASPAARVSFLGDHARMLHTARQLQPALRAWGSYAGMAYHGLLD